MAEDRTRTLVVTVDPGLIQQIRTAVEGRGGAVRPCPTAEGATAELHEHTYGLAVLASELADADGFELARTLKAIDPALTVVLLGEDRDGKGIEAADAAGADAFIQRPFKVAELTQRLQEIMGDAWMASSGEAPAASAHAESLVDPGTGVFPADTGYDVSVFDDEDSREPGHDSTQDLPVVNIQAFDEDNPVSVPVDGRVTAHGLTPIRVLATVSEASGESVASQGTAEEAPADPIQRQVEGLLAPGGALSHLIDEAVGRAVSKALAEQLPAVLARLAGDSE